LLQARRSRQLNLRALQPQIEYVPVSIDQSWKQRLTVPIDHLGCRILRSQTGTVADLEHFPCVERERAEGLEVCPHEGVAINVGYDGRLTPHGRRSGDAQYKGNDRMLEQGFHEDFPGASDFTMMRETLSFAMNAGVYQENLSPRGLFFVDHPELAGSAI
jgi:hypothetical protein